MSTSYFIKEKYFFLLKKGKLPNGERKHQHGETVFFIQCNKMIISWHRLYNRYSVVGFDGEKNTIGGVVSYEVERTSAPSDWYFIVYLLVIFKLRDNFACAIKDLSVLISDSAIYRL